MTAASESRQRHASALVPGTPEQTARLTPEEHDLVRTGELVQQSSPHFGEVQEVAALPRAEMEV